MMEKYLLDTHIILWYFQGNENLSSLSRKIIESESCFCSIISLWEIAIKQKLNKLDFTISITYLEELCMESGLKIIPITSEALELTKSLPFIHNDPFDRLLICQAKTEDLCIITKDSIIPSYSVNTIW